jgi:hypothetical protein
MNLHTIQILFLRISFLYSPERFGFSVELINPFNFHMNQVAES